VGTERADRKHAGAQAGHGLAVQLANARLGHAQHLSDLAQVEFFLVVKAHHELLALGEILDGLHQGAPQVGVLDQAERVGTLVDDVAVEEVLVVSAAEILEIDELVPARVLQDLLVLRERHADLLGQFGFGGLTTEALFQCLHRRFDTAHVAAQAARHPVILSQAVQHGSADALRGVGLELCAQPVLISGNGIEQADHAVLHDIVNLHAGRQLRHQVMGDALDQRRVQLDELCLVRLAFGVVHP
jgi:hypothetical protein